MTTVRLLAERYELGDRLGAFGMSDVYRGVDRRLGRDVAVKLLRADQAENLESQALFRRAAALSAELNHPGIVAVYDSGEIRSSTELTPYLVMEHVDGRTLYDITRNRAPGHAWAVAVMADVCAALDFSHRNGVIHCDIKPSNVMVNEAGAVKVVCSDIAQALGDSPSATQGTTVYGTAHYLSPEQSCGRVVDPRTDVYAAGCVLFHLLTRNPPFTGATTTEIAVRHVRDSPRAPSELNTQVGAQLDTIVLKALRKDPADRYQTAAAMRADLVGLRSGRRQVAPVVTSLDERATPAARARAGARPEPRRATPRARPLLERWFGDALRSAWPRSGTGVFLSYRRHSDAHFAGRLFDRLSGTAEVFMDVDSIDLGVDFVHKIEDQLARCSAVLIVIGRDWISITDSKGRRRLDDPNDFVRLEVEAALRSGVRVIPVLVEGATMPDPADLPPSVAPLTRRHGLVVSHERFNSDVARLAATLRRILPD